MEGSRPRFWVLNVISDFSGERLEIEVRRWKLEGSRSRFWVLNVISDFSGERLEVRG